MICLFYVNHLCNLIVELTLFDNMFCLIPFTLLSAPTSIDCCIVVRLFVALLSIASLLCCGPRIVIHLVGRFIYDGHCFIGRLTARNQGASPRHRRVIRAPSVARVGDVGHRLPLDTSDGVPVLLMTDFMVSRDCIMASIENLEGDVKLRSRRGGAAGRA